MSNKENLNEFFDKPEELEAAVLAACEASL